MVITWNLTHPTFHPTRLDINFYEFRIIVSFAPVFFAEDTDFSKRNKRKNGLQTYSLDKYLQTFQCRSVIPWQFHYMSPNWAELRQKHYGGYY